MKRRAKSIYWWWADAYKVANHIKQCSCMSCGNPRRDPWYGGDTMAEKRFKASADYQEEILYWDDEDWCDLSWYWECGVWNDWEYDGKGWCDSVGERNLTEEEREHCWDNGLEWWELWQTSE